MNRSLLERVIEGVIAAVLLGGFLFLKTYSFHPTATDDWIYTYLAQRVTEGAWPYRDFFFAHPPLHLFALIPSLSIFGFDVVGVRLSASLGCLAAGVCLWRAVRRLGGPWAGLIALFTFLFSMDVLRASSHITGTNLSVAFLAGGAWAFTASRPKIGAALFAAAGLVAFYVLPVAFGIFALYAWRQRRRAIAPIVVFLAIFVGVQAVVAAPAPSAYLDGVYRYHGMKKASPTRSERTWTRSLAYHPLGAAAVPLAVGGWLALLTTSAATGAAARAKTRAPRQKRNVDPRLTAGLGAALLLTALELAALLSLRELYAYYLMLLHALTAALLGLGAVGCFVAVQRTRERRSWGRGGAVLALTAAACIGALALRPSETEFLRKGGVSRKTWESSVVGGPLDALTKALFWRQEHRFGSPPSSITMYLWHEAAHLRFIDDAVAAIRARARPGDLCVGDSQIGPLLALRSGMRIIDDEADTNIKRFNSGLVSLPEFLREIDRPELRWVFVAEKRYVDSLSPFLRWRTENFAPIYQRLDDSNHLLIAAERRPEGGADAPPRASTVAPPRGVEGNDGAVEDDVD